MSVEDGGYSPDEEVNTSEESEEIKNLRDSIKRAEAVGPAMQDVVDALKEKLHKLENPEDDSDEDATVEDVVEEEEVVESVPAFIGIDKEGSEEDQQRYEEVMELANELFVEERDENGELVDLVINPDADQDEIFDKFDDWYDKYKESFPEPKADIKVVDSRFANGKIIELRAWEDQLASSDADPATINSILNEMDSIFKKGKGITESDVKQIDSLLAETQQLVTKAA